MFPTDTLVRRTRRLLPALIVCLVAALPVAAQDPPVGTAGMSAEEKAMFDAMMKASTPGPNHEMLTSLAGEWTFKNKMWMKPSEPATESTGTVNYSELLGGRFLQGNYRGDMMGMPFEGIAVMGYDNINKKFQASWIDNFGTAIMYMAGEYDPAAKAIVYRGEVDDMMKPGTKVKIREVVRIDSPDSHTMEWYELRDGKETKTMEIVYTRKK
ncbi:MAG: DUF1579 domain-containing protein [Vicinamibacterales bacterium]